MAINPGGVRWKQYTTAASFTGTKPTLAIQGDLMIAWAMTDSTGTFTPPAGWTLVGTEGVLGGGKWRVYSKRHGDEAGTTTYTFGSGGVSWTVKMWAFSGNSIDVDVGTVGDWESSSGTSTPSHASINYQFENSLCLALCIHEGGTATYTAPSGFAELHDATGNTSDWRDEVGSTSSGTVTWTASTSSNYETMLIEIPESKTCRRLYFDSAAAAEITPSSWCAQWDLPADKSGLPTRKLNDVRGSSALSWRTFVDNSATNNQDSALARFVRKLGTGYIQGGFNAVLQCAESNSSANDFSQISLKIIQPSGADRAVLFAGQTNTGTSGSEFPASTTSPYQASAANRYFPKATLSRAMAAAWSYEGDFLVVEIGFRQNSTATTYTTNMYIGEPTTTDLTDLNETETTDNTPWIEFPWGITFSGEGADFREVNTPTYIGRLGG
jgi:hypothetical protein